jgi:FkbM family methyltransferase
MTVLHSIRSFARRTTHIDVQRANPMTIPFLRLAAMLKQREVRTVIDVGANDGGFAADLFDAGYAGKIISVEPLPDARAALETRARAFGERWILGPQVAFSDRAGTAKFHVAGNSVSSSLLPMTRAHEHAEPTSRTVRLLEVETVRLDDWIESRDVDGPAFLKLDVQGAEAMVLAGAGRSLRTLFVGVQLEMSLVTLYQGQPDADDLTTVLNGAGFSLWDIIPGFRDPQTFRLLQYDGVFFR